ncbi:sensor histidine kinase [Arenibaculum pallidiluteum]|uniref:sensor histidine kinase n=1 Tax=Arenibaculum pallidiluteum TaxID=2812559 RepID=UPI002E2D5BE3|nr:HAMP domain-containing sensor histidine kinase [Arenibaculum pallidiluteum]
MTVRARTGLAWLLRSLASQLVLLMVVFLAVPVLIYNQLREADAHKQALLLEGAAQQGWTTARALAPVLLRATPASLPHMGEELARFAGPGTGLKLLLRPTGVPGAQGFFYVAAAPATPNDYLDLERRHLLDGGVLARLAQGCEGEQPLAIRVPTPAGGLELLTSITPVRAPMGCWAVVTSSTAPASLLGTSLGRAYWQAPEMQAAAAVYIALAALVLAVFAGVWGNLRRFGGLARRIGDQPGRPHSFAALNTVPELAGVAEDFDRLVNTLRSSAETIRRTAEDNAHAFKTPIAVIRQSLEPLKRSLPETDARGRRAVDMIERSLDRLDGLVSFARRMDEAAADLLEPPRRKVEISDLVQRMMTGYGPLLAERRIRLAATIEPRLVVLAGRELLETVIENIVENAISFSPPGSVLAVSLARQSGRAVFAVQDQGPGVPEGDLERIFERYFSKREHEPGRTLRTPAPLPDAGEVAVAPAEGSAREPHFGIGLWIVRRNVEAVGGTVKAANRATGGLEVRIELPLAP